MSVVASVSNLVLFSECSAAQEHSPCRHERCHSTVTVAGWAKGSISPPKKGCIGGALVLCWFVLLIMVNCHQSTQSETDQELRIRSHTVYLCLGS